MSLASDRCICLRRVEYSETSQILTLFAREHGIIRAIAKGAHRRTKAGASRFDGGIDLIDLGDAVFTDAASRDLATLTDWKLIEGHLALRKSLRGLYLALYAIELVGSLFEEHDPHPDLFDHLNSLPTDLASAQVEETFLAFHLKLLEHAGFAPQLDSCGECGRPINAQREVFISASRGTALCGNCAATIPDRQPVDARLIRLLQSVRQLTETDLPRRLPRLTRHQTDPLNAILADHAQHALGKRLRLTPYILRLRRATMPPNRLVTEKR